MPGSDPEGFIFWEIGQIFNYRGLYFPNSYDSASAPYKSCKSSHIIVYYKIYVYFMQEKMHFFLSTCTILEILLSEVKLSMVM